MAIDVVHHFTEIVPDGVVDERQLETLQPAAHRDACDRSVHSSSSAANGTRIAAAISPWKPLSTIGAAPRAEDRVVRGPCAARARGRSPPRAAHQRNQALAHLGGEREGIRLVRAETAQHGLPGLGVGGRRPGVRMICRSCASGMSAPRRGIAPACSSSRAESHAHCMTERVWAPGTIDLAGAALLD